MSLFVRQWCREPGVRMRRMYQTADIILCRYHAENTLRTMKAYQIGRITSPWTNLTPPIRGGVYSEFVDEESVSSEDEQDHRSFASSTTSLYDGEDLEREISKELVFPLSNEPPTTRDDIVFRDKDISWNTPDVVSKRVDTPTDVFISKAIQTEIDEGLDEYPSLDAETQQKIVLKYQALHQRAKDEGFYECRYSEYGKEFVRYALLFTVFFVCLRCGWYMTSAAFLGLFWVGLSYQLPGHLLKRTAPNHVHSP